MRKRISKIIGVESFLAGVFITCVFYGDVHFGFVFPLSMIVLPVLLAFVLAMRQTTSGGFNAGIALLLGLLSVVALQFLIKTPAPTQTDLSVYGPVLYAIATIFTFSLVRVSDATIWRSLILGGLVTAAVMIATIALVPDGKFMIPGQNATETEHEFKQSRSPGRDVTKYHSNAASVPGYTDDTSVRPFYGIKNKVRNALGRSNYLAAFFVFLFTVSLFRRSWIYGFLFGLLTITTLSRLGMLWLVAVFLIWLVHYLKIPTKKFIRPFVAFLASAALAVALWPEQLSNLPDIQSVKARLSFWQSGFPVVADHFLFGTPRSAIVDKYGYLITWNPHNSLLWVASIFGMFGLAFYLAYVFIAMRSVYHKAKESRLWLGILVGLAILFMWSLVEIIVLTPAFEILLALVYGLSRPPFQRICFKPEARLDASRAKCPP